jgi:hypothetical protein
VKNTVAAAAVVVAGVAVAVVVVAVAAADAVSSRAVKTFFNRLRRFHGGAGQLGTGVLPDWHCQPGTRVVRLIP